MYRIIYADVYSGLGKIKDNSIDVAVTSPPYWRQRDYGFEEQIGSEPTYNKYIGKLVSIFRLLRQKLKEKGIFFLNIGDKYLSKYGKSPLGMIPYKLAYFMALDGWILNDIIIWYKPNHMPSSIKNRFVNSYEPVFVFSKIKNNIFNKYRENFFSHSNILKINLKPTLYKHVAVYPENLVVSLLKMVNLQENGIVLDPFAGSGTTLKAVQNMNYSFNNKNLSAIMVEQNKEYIEIIKKRCSLSNNDVISKDFVPYSYENIQEKNFCKFHFEKDLSLSKKIKENGFFEICENKDEYYNWLSLLLNRKIKENLSKDAVLFIGSKDFDIKLIYNTSLLNNYGWIIRNMVVVENDGKWFPVFMLVDDNKTVRYRFNYKNLNLNHKSKNERKWDEVNFVGYKVIDNLRKNKKEGVVVKVLEKNTRDFPKYVIVKWDDGTFSKEFVIFSEEEVNSNLEIIENKNNGVSLIKEKKELIGLCTAIQHDENYFVLQNGNGYVDKNYNGKFKDEMRKNWGASPGARASLEQDYFSKKRLYEVNQSLVADYLNFKRIEKGLSKKALIDLFPEEYKHTVGHWFRKDFGGSIPLPEDWEFLKKILDIDEDFTNYVCKTALKLQTVKNGEYKLPEDFVSISFLEKMKVLTR